MHEYLIKASSIQDFELILSDFKDDEVEVRSLDRDSLVIQARLTITQANAIREAFGSCELV